MGNKNILSEEEKKSAWATVLDVLKTILTLGINHLIKYLSNHSK